MLRWPWEDPARGGASARGHWSRSSVQTVVDPFGGDVLGDETVSFGTKYRSSLLPQLWVSAQRTPSRDVDAPRLTAFDWHTLFLAAWVRASRLNAPIPLSRAIQGSSAYRSNRPGAALTSQGSCCALAPSSGACAPPRSNSPGPSIPSAVEGVTGYATVGDDSFNSLRSHSGSFACPVPRHLGMKLPIGGR